MFSRLTYCSSALRGPECIQPEDREDGPDGGLCERGRGGLLAV